MFIYRLFRGNRKKKLTKLNISFINFFNISDADAIIKALRLTYPRQTPFQNEYKVLSGAY